MVESINQAFGWLNPVSGNGGPWRRKQRASKGCGCCERRGEVTRDSAWDASSGHALAQAELKQDAEKLAAKATSAWLEEIAERLGWPRFAHQDPAEMKQGATATWLHLW